MASAVGGFSWYSGFGGIFLGTELSFLARVEYFFVGAGGFKELFCRWVVFFFWVMLGMAPLRLFIS